MGETALQIELNSLAPINMGANVLFDSSIYLAGNITYDETTGVITFLEVGRYIVNWWLATQASVSTNGASFALSSSQDDLLIGNSPDKNGEVYGIGIIDVSEVPVTLSLVNISTATIYLSVQVPLRGTLTVVKDDLIAYGGLYSDQLQVITVPDDGSAVVIELPELMQARNITLGIDNMMVTVNGDYKIEFSAILQSTSGTFGVVLSVRANGTEIIALSLGFILDEQFESFASSAIVPLSAGDVLDLVLYSATGGTALLGPLQNATLVATLLGP